MCTSTIRIWVETGRGGAVIVFALDWPGASGRGHSIDEALDDLRTHLAWVEAWLSDHRRALPCKLDLPMNLVQRISAKSNPLEGDTEGFFSWDAEPFTDDEVNDAGELLRWSRADLLHLVDAIGESSLDARMVPDGRTIRETLDHVAIAERWYTTRILPPGTVVQCWREFGRDAFARMEAVRRRVRRDVLPRLREMMPAERVFRYEHRCEVWTARKMLRRMVWHELYHLRQLERLRERK